jgi:SNF2 family DNA or RNA helicase
MCRSVIKASELVYVSKENDPEDEKKEDRTVKKTKQKQETVLDIVSEGLNETPKKKFLIFSMYDESFSIIRRELEENKIDYVEISGSKATRDSKIKKFKEDKVNVVFLNSRFNGAGINLEMATDIILYHEMPQSIRDQVVGRALRVGRECDLTIHNLVYEQQ